MPIETANYIDQLDPTNPAAPDLLADTDNHLRMIKQVLKNTFPSVTGPVSATQYQLQANVPVGGIIMWNGNAASVPAGWGLCTGATYTRLDGAGSIVSPNLTDRFIKGLAVAGTDNGTTGGAVIHTGSTSASGDHTHSGYTDAQGTHSHGGATAGHVLTVGQLAYHTHTTSVAVIGGGSGSGTYFPSNNIFMEDRGSTGAGGNEAHAHGISADGNHAHNIATYGAGNHAHTVTIADGRPPYFTLAFIIKL
jgi:hypothetical protein